MIPFPDKKYNIIYADPPWSFRAGGLKNATNHYNCMSIEDIKSLPVSEIADDNCLLFLWVIYPLLPECIETLKSWGFAYSTCGFTWVKKNKVSDSWFWGLGCYTRSNPEICLIGKKGKFKKQSSSALCSFASINSSTTMRPKSPISPSAMTRTIISFKYFIMFPL